MTQQTKSQIVCQIAREQGIPVIRTPLSENLFAPMSKPAPVTELQLIELTACTRELFRVEVGQIGLPVSLTYNAVSQQYWILINGDLVSTCYAHSIAARLFNQHAGLD